MLVASLTMACRGASNEPERPADRTVMTNGFVPARDLDAVDQPESRRVVGRLRAGTAYTLSKRGGPGSNWCKVHVDGAEGWVLCIEATAAPPNPVATPRATPVGTGFGYWVLTLSWSPSFCATPAGSRNADQCGPGRHHGFVVHGLWPQNERGWPEDCPAGAPPSKELVARTLDLMPSAHLIEHEWEKHGTCSGLGADDYFATLRAAFASIRIPDAYVQPKQPFTTSLEEIERAFIAANPRLDRSGLSIECSGDLDEVRICLDKQLVPRACGADVRDVCKGKVTVPPLR